MTNFQVLKVEAKVADNEEYNPTKDRTEITDYESSPANWRHQIVSIATGGTTLKCDEFTTFDMIVIHNRDAINKITVTTQTGAGQTPQQDIRAGQIAILTDHDRSSTPNIVLQATSAVVEIEIWISGT